jgi:DNA-binding XRE family transcriptional regulator
MYSLGYHFFDLTHPGKLRNRLGRLILSRFRDNIASRYVPNSGQMAAPSKNISGPMVKRYRDTLGLSQQELAAKAQVAGWDIGRDVIAKIETGIRCVDDIELVKLAKLLGVEPQLLLPK